MKKVFLYIRRLSACSPCSNHILSTRSSICIRLIRFTTFSGWSGPVSRELGPIASPDDESKFEIVASVQALRENALFFIA